MVTERDAARRGAEEKEKQENLKKIEPVVPDVEGDTNDGGDEGSNEEKAVDPAHLIEKFVHRRITDVVNLYAPESGVCHPSAVRRSGFVVTPVEDSPQIHQFASVRFFGR